MPGRVDLHSLGNGLYQGSDGMLYVDEKTARAVYALLKDSPDAPCHIIALFDLDNEMGQR